MASEILKGFGDLNRYNATVNGIPLSGTSLAIDPFYSSYANIIHYLVNKNDIIQLSTEYNAKHIDSAERTEIKIIYFIKKNSMNA